mgnify:CR=1 FL=1
MVLSEDQLDIILVDGEDVAESGAFKFLEETRHVR